VVSVIALAIANGSLASSVASAANGSFVEVLVNLVSVDVVPRTWSAMAARSILVVVVVLVLVVEVLEVEVLEVEVVTVVVVVTVDVLVVVTKSGGASATMPRMCSTSLAARTPERKAPWAVAR